MKNLFTSISIHALREEGDFLFVFRALFYGISIHALREEGDKKISPLVS